MGYSTGAQNHGILHSGRRFPGNVNCQLGKSDAVKKKKMWQRQRQQQQQRYELQEKDNVKDKNHDNDDNNSVSSDLNTKCHSRQNRCSQQSARFDKFNKFGKLVSHLCGKEGWESEAHLGQVTGVPVKEIECHDVAKFSWMFTSQLFTLHKCFAS